MTRHSRVSGNSLIAGTEISSGSTSVKLASLILSMSLPLFVPQIAKASLLKPLIGTFTVNSGLASSNLTGISAIAYVSHKGRQLPDPTYVAPSNDHGIDLITAFCGQEYALFQRLRDFIGICQSIDFFLYNSISPSIIHNFHDLPLTSIVGRSSARCFDNDSRTTQ